MRIGIDLGGTKIEGIILDDEGKELTRRRIPTPRDYEATVNAIAGLVGELEGHFDAQGNDGPKPDFSVGIGIPGTISPTTGLIKNANSTWLIGRPLDKDLEAVLGRPLRMTNDANCFAVSEAVDGAGADARLVFGVILGTGVGGGVVIDRQPLLGVNAIAGEWGHNPLPWPTDDERPGELCYCGQRGCIETFLSGSGLARDFPAKGDGKIGAKEIAARAEDGDSEALAAIERYGERLARALACVINLLDPDVIVLGGGLSNIGRLYDNVPRLWGDRVFSDLVDTPLRQNRHGDSSGVRGAAWLWPREAG